MTREAYSHEAVRRSDSPGKTLLSFLQSAYEAGARTARWNLDDLSTRGPAES